MPYKELPTPDKQKATRCHDNSFDALFDEALDEMQEKLLRTGNFIGHCPTPRKEHEE